MLIKKDKKTSKLQKEKKNISTLALRRYRVAKMHRMPYLYRSFPAKEPYN